MPTDSSSLFTTNSAVRSARSAAASGTTTRLKESNRRQFNNVFLCLATGILYGLSWPILPDVNLSFLAWFAFVPLFVFLERQQNSFWKSLAGTYGAMLIFGLLTAGWLFSFPQAKVQIATIVLLEVFYFTFPVIPFFFLQRRLGFDRALWLFPLLWTVWEWLYLSLEFTMGTHLSAYSQSSNTWLIQYIDLTGMWGIACWLLFFNVLIYRAYRAAGDRVLTGAFWRKLAPPVVLMLGLPLAYGVYAFGQFDGRAGKSLSVTVVPTYFTAGFYKDYRNHRIGIERTLHVTDSLHYAQRESNTVPELYLWPETGTYLTLEEAQLAKVLREAVVDYDAALLTGSSILADTATGDFRNYVTGTLLSAQTPTIHHHRKTQLTPGQEIIPYHRWLAKLPGFPVALEDPNFRKRGNSAQPLPLTTWDDEKFALGVSLCFEQWHPAHWAAMARNGAEVFLHLAGENWYGDVGFQQFMANVSRLRCIETRRAGARSSNVGISGFIDPLGRMDQVSSGPDARPLTASIIASTHISPYARFPRWFPLLCGALLLLGATGFFTSFK
jgi:apolipoprotein N-acyltransferase